jgi:hypothetical protein
MTLSLLSILVKKESYPREFMNMAIEKQLPLLVPRDLLTFWELIT